VEIWAIIRPTGGLKAKHWLPASFYYHAVDEVRIGGALRRESFPYMTYDVKENRDRIMRIMMDQQMRFCILSLMSAGANRD